MTRREQWTRFYERALTGNCTDQNQSCHDADENAAKSADLAMARLDAKDFPEPKVQVLLKAADSVWGTAEHGAQRGAYVADHLLVALGRAIHDMKQEE